MIITGIITVFTAIVYWYILYFIQLLLAGTLINIDRFVFPDSPANARFLTAEEKRLAVLRIRVNQTGVENKHFKPEQ